jgi:glutamate-ammonia-ligase adenylyltransferase
VGAAFEAERDAILRLPRDAAALAADVVAMRRKMLAGHPNTSQLFDLKHDAGGMVDIEFVVQYLVLVHAHRHAILTRNAGNIALLGFAADLTLVPAELARTVADAYREYRRLQHQVRLTLASHARVDPAPQAGRRQAVGALWSHVFGEPWHAATARGLPATPGTDGEIG